MQKEKLIRYSQNIHLKALIAVSGRTVTDLAKAIKVSRTVLSNTINGHYKGDNIVRALTDELNKPSQPTQAD